MARQPLRPAERVLPEVARGAVDLTASFDWGSTDLGPRESWPPGLNAIVETMLSAALPMALVLGPSFVLVYNDVYADLLGEKHPRAFGCPAPEALSENWHAPGHGDVVERVYRTGEPFSETETRLPLRRAGSEGPAETVIFSRAYTPVRTDDGTIVGVLTVIQELSELARALSGVAELSAQLASALTVDDVVREVLRHAMTIGADHARVLLPEGSATRMARRAAADPWDESTERLPPLWVQIPADAPLPSAATVRDGRPRWLENGRELEAFRSGLEHEPLGPTPLGAVATVPLPVGPWQGALSLGWHDSRAFSDAYQSALNTVGTLVGAALARAQRFDEQFGLADTLQRSLLPTGLPHLPGLVLGARYASHAPGSSIGGDFYDAFALPDGRVLVAIGDVVGQGAEAATLSGQVRAALRALALQNPEPAAVLAALDPLVRSIGTGALVTALVAVIDEPNGVLLLADAGHPQPLLRSRATDGPGTATVIDLPVGPPLGVASPRASTTRAFDPGDLLLLVNDGLLGDPDSGSTGLEPLRLVLAERADLDPRRLCAHLLERFETGHDDVTLLAVARAEGDSRTTARTFPAESTSPGQARRWARSLLSSWGLDDDRVEVAVLCLNELVTNVLLHARTSARVEVDLDETRLLILVNDEGQAAPTLNAQLSRTDAVRGRGLGLVEQLSAAWGTERDSKGMTVWFEVARDQAD